MQGAKVDLPVRAAQRPACLRRANESKAPLKSRTNKTSTPTRQHTWKTQDKVATAALFAALAFQPGIVLTNAPLNLCFTSSQRLYGTDWVLPDFDDFMLSRCPAPYGFDDYSGAGLDYPAGLYLNATAGRW